MHLRKVVSIRVALLFFLFFILFRTTPAYAQTVPYQGAKVSLTFDDGFLTTYTNVLPILTQRNITATEFVTTSFIDDGITADGLPAMTWQQVQNLQNQYGWEIGSHTLTHPELPLVSVNQIKTEIASSKSILESKGLTISSFASPFGAYDNTVLAEIAKSYNLHRGFWDRDDLNSYPYDRSVIMVQSVETGVSFATVKGWIDQAISQKKWLVLVFHEVRPTLNPNYEYTITNQELTQIADYIKQTGIPTVLMNHTLQKPGVNLLSNATFIKGITEGWTTDSPSQVQADSANNGSYPSSTDAIKLVGSQNIAHFYSPAVPVVTTAQYAFQAFVNADAVTSGNIGISVDEYGTTGNLLASKSLGTVPADTVKYFSALYKPSSSAVNSIKIQTFISAGAKGIAYVDNYELYNLSGINPSSTPTPTTIVTPSPTVTIAVTPTNTPTLTPTKTPTPTLTTTPTPTIPPSTNLVQNNSFELVTNGWADNWTKDSTSFTIDILSNGNDGTNSLHLRSNTAESHVFSQKIAVTPGNTYTWKQYIKTVKVGGEFGFYIDEYNSQGTWISGQWKGMITTLFSGTKQFSYKPTSSKVSSIGLQYYVLKNGNFDLYLDSVSFSK